MGSSAGRALRKSVRSELLGRVRSIPRLANSEYFIRHIHGGFLKGRERKDGTKTVTLSVQRQRTKFVIAELVAMAFGEVSVNA